MAKKQGKSGAAPESSTVSTVNDSTSDGVKYEDFVKKAVDKVSETAKSDRKFSEKDALDLVQNIMARCPVMPESSNKRIWLNALMKFFYVVGNEGLDEAMKRKFF